MKMPQNGRDYSGLVGFLNQTCIWLIKYIDHNSSYLCDFTLQIGEKSTRYRYNQEPAPDIAIPGEIPSQMSGLISLIVPVDWTKGQFDQAKAKFEEWLPTLRSYSGLSEIKININGLDYCYKHSVGLMLMLPEGAFDTVPANQHNALHCLLHYGDELNRIAEVPYVGTGAIENLQVMVGDKPLVKYGSIPEQFEPDLLIITFPHQATNDQLLQADEKMRAWLPNLAGYCGRPIEYRIIRGPNPKGMRPWD
ncbi:MAG: hypothetical protein WCO23_00915 [bacterium]